MPNIQQLSDGFYDADRYQGLSRNVNTIPVEPPPRFWMVFCPSNNNGPTVMHSTFEAAQTEAARLARKHRKAFYVLQSTHRVDIAPSPVLITDLLDNSFKVCNESQNTRA